MTEAFPAVLLFRRGENGTVVTLTDLSDKNYRNGTAMTPARMATAAVTGTVTPTIDWSGLKGADSFKTSTTATGLLQVDFTTGGQVTGTFLSAAAGVAVTSLVAGSVTFTYVSGGQYTHFQL